MSSSQQSVSRCTTVPDVRARKIRNGDEPMSMITAYDAPGAAMVSDAGADMILVGDSVAMVVLGYDDTLSVTIDDMVHHVSAVARAKPESLIVGDMPWMSYHVNDEETVINAAKLIRAGAQCVKLEGGQKRTSTIEKLVDAEIPVMGHIGLTPQSMHVMGGFKVQGRESEVALKMVDDAKALQYAGCFAIVIEGVPSEVAALITEAIDIPTIGIGAGPQCDGQVLVFHDILGIESRLTPKFVRTYADVSAVCVKALSEFVDDVHDGSFPSMDESYELTKEQSETLKVYGG